MPIPIACPTCTARLSLPDKLPPGIKSLKCPQCKNPISLDDVARLRPTAPKSAAPKPPPPAEPKSALAPRQPAGPGALPDVDEVGFLADDAPSPKLPPQPPVPSTTPQYVRGPAEPGGLPDIDEVSFLEDDAPPRAAPQPAKPAAAPKNSTPIELDDVGFLDEDAGSKVAKQTPAPTKPVARQPPAAAPPSVAQFPDLSLEEVGFADEKPAAKPAPTVKKAPAPVAEGAIPNLSLDDAGFQDDKQQAKSKANERAKANIKTPAEDEEVVEIEVEEEFEVVEDVGDDLEVIEDEEEVPEVEPAEIEDEVEVADVVEAVDDLEVVDDPLLAPVSIKKGLLDYDKLVIKPRTGYLLSLGYDILNPITRKRLGTVLEETDTGNKVTGLLIGKALSTSTVVIREGKQGKRLCTIRRPPFMFKARVEIYDRRKEMLGYFDNKLFSLVGGFWVYDWKDREVAEVKGQWGWRPKYEFLNHRGKKLGVFMYESAATGKITINFSAGTSWYIEFSKSLKDPEQRLLLMASAIAFDMVRVSSGRR